MISRYRLAFIVAILVLGLVLFGLFFRSEAGAGKADTQERRDIEQSFSDGTPQDAYAAFVKKNSDATEQKQHLTAHSFGEVLYEHEGMNGFPVCGAEFGFGCYHGFMGALVNEHGIDAVGQLDAACIRVHGNLGLGCFHGIGHGLVSYYGYGISDLDKVLSVCGTLTWKGTYGGCADGAFMEYNLRTMQSDTGSVRRPFSAEASHEPCDSVESQFKIVCQFNQGEWWRQSLRGETDASSQIGALCISLTNFEEKKGCFRGVGYSYAAPLDFNAVKGADFCEQYRSVSGNANRWCREGYAWALYATGAREGATSVCTDGLSKSESTRCLKEYLFVIN